MERYIVNSKMPGFTSVDIDDKSLLGRDKIILVIANEEIDDHLSKYYTSIKEILISGGRVMLIGVGDKSRAFLPLASLMVCYSAYDIYMVQTMDIVTVPYINSLIERKPSFEEVQSFIGGKVTAIGDIDTIILGIQSLVNDNNIDGFKVFLEQHMPSIESMMVTIDYLKKQAELTNSKELVTKLDGLKEKVTQLENKLEEAREKCNELRDSKIKLNNELGEYKKQIDVLRTRCEELESAPAGTRAIHSYNEVKTSLITCKTKTIIYFKEVSYIPYMNTLVNTLFELIKSRTTKVKMIIYDSNTEMFNSYNRINNVSSVEYADKKDNYVAKAEKLVVTDPNPVIITDILQYDPGYDVVIVYDRMRKLTDVVSGNNVYKFFVINSLSDYNNIKDTLKITDEGRVFTRPEVAINTEFKIPRIADFPSSGQANGDWEAQKSRRIVLYSKIKTPKGKGLTMEFFETVRLKELFSRR